MQTNYFIFRYKAVFSFFFMMLGLISCAKDLGNYDYKDVNEVKIEFEHESYSAVYKKDTLRIEPKIISTDPSMKMSDYEFEWLAVFTVDDVTKRIKIGSSLKLEYPVTLHPGSYSVHLKVKDKNTELQWRKDFSLSVRTEISRGFLLLGEDETGYANVDMIAMPKDTFVIKNLLTDNGLPKLKGPQRILYTGTYIDYLNPYVRLWIMTKDRSYYVSTKTMRGDDGNTFEKMVYTYYDIPEKQDPIHIPAKTVDNAMHRTRVVVTQDGNIFQTSLMMSDGLYANPMNKVKGSDKLFKTFPYLFVASKWHNTTIAFDMDANRFVHFGDYDTNSKPLADAPDAPFTWQQPQDRVLIYGENTMNQDGGGHGNSFALFKKKDNSELFLCKFFVSSRPLKRSAAVIDPLVARNIEKAALFAFSSKRSLLFYAVGSTLYAYDYNKGNEKLYTMEMPGEITMIKFDLFSGVGNFNDLFIATFNSDTKGMLQKFTLGDDPNTLDLKPDDKSKWDGLVKIVDMDWRNSSV